MEKRIFGTLHPFFEKGHINGRTIANAGFMTALLTRDPFAEYHFFVAQPAELAAELQALSLPAVCRGAVHTFHRTALSQQLRCAPYGVFHFSDPVSEFIPLCQARNAWAPEIFPVTAVNHTISYAAYNAAFLQHLWAGITPRDAIGCNSTAALAVLRCYYDHLRHSHGPNIHSQQPALHVLPMGVNPDLLPRRDASARQSLRQQLQISDTCIVFLLFGRIAVADKMDPQPLLLALRRAQDMLAATGPNPPQVRLLMGGYTRPDDTSVPYLQAVADMLGISLTLLPNPTDAEKHALFAAADVFVSPSDNIQETFGLSLLEAGAAQLPTIASDWDGYRDILLPGQTGLSVPTLAPASSPDMDILTPLLFENQHHLLRSQQTVVSVPALAEALCTLALDAPARARMGAAAHARVMTHFSWDAVLNHWLKLWQTLRDIPLSPDQREELRHQQHPCTLPLGSIFAPYATATLHAEQEVRCTPMGEALRKGSLPFAAFNTLGESIQEAELRPLLILARKPLSIAQLVLRLGSALPADSIREEKIHFYILWALKHDLLELYSISD